MGTRNWRVDFKRPHDANPKRRAKVFTFTLAENEEQAAENVKRHHPGSEITKVEEQRR